MTQILQTLTRSTTNLERMFQAKSHIDRDSRFKIQRTIPKITADDSYMLLEEYDDFEEAFIRTNPSNARDWCMALEEALIHKAKSWKDMAIMLPPGDGLYRQVMDPSCPNHYAEAYYRFIRAEIFERAGLRHENPGEIS